jgi:eukaryotic-like serine/threonine-protein kinase
VDHLPLTVFRRSALASGLLTVEQILEAEQALRAQGEPVGPWTEISDDLLAAKLVELGRVNRWQAEQLKVGRSKFNLGPYLVIDSIGQGGMGQVFKAEHRLMGRVVAIKVLPRHRSTPDAIASFTREIRAQAQFDHENLVRAFDAGHDGNVYFLVTEFVPGTDLRKLVRARGKLSMQDAATIISQAARGLAHAHSRGLVHRDMKPGNLLVTPDGQTKVSDLGLASFLGVEDPTDPRAGRIVGTADYLSPEHITSPSTLSPASDI